MTSKGTANFKNSVYCKTMTQVHHGEVSWNLQILGKQYVGFLAMPKHITDSIKN